MIPIQNPVARRSPCLCLFWAETKDSRGWKCGDQCEECAPYNPTITHGGTQHIPPVWLRNRALPAPASQVPSPSDTLPNQDRCNTIEAKVPDQSSPSRSGEQAAWTIMSAAMVGSDQCCNPNPGFKKGDDVHSPVAQGKGGGMRVLNIPMLTPILLLPFRLIVLSPALCLLFLTLHRGRLSLLRLDIILQDLSNLNQACPGVPVPSHRWPDERLRAMPLPLEGLQVPPPEGRRRCA
mmetsp:Transcript_62201/g.110890  ORF Transcript_62201/g.110890 Transcript_62201/m.110890 type:complete len:236 (-) Transcript_62201:1851-2558(-)